MATKRNTPPSPASAEREVRRLRAEVEAASLRSMLTAHGSGNQATYRGAARTRLDTGWSTLPGGGVRQANRNLRESFRQMRARARQLEQDNVLAGAVLDRAVENVIGTGLKIRPTSSSPAWNAAVAAAWKKWTTGKRADVRHMHTFAAMQRLFYRAKLRDGDAGVLLTEELDLQGRSHPRLQIIEGEHIDNPLGVVVGCECRTTHEAGAIYCGNCGLTLRPEVIDGVELGANDEAVAYYLRPRTAVDGKPIRIRARDFIYLCRPPLYSSVRGESAFNGGWTLFDQIVGYLEAVVVASRVGACQAGIIKKNNPSQAMNGLPTIPGTSTNGEARKSFSVEPGSMNFLGPDEDFTAFNPSQPQQQMESAINTFARFVGLRFGLTIEQVLLNFSLTSYSSSRAARNQSDLTAAQEQEDFAATFFARVFPWAVSKWHNAGLLGVPKPEDGTWDAYEWIPQGKAPVDPTKDIKAKREMVELGVEAPTNIATEMGYEYADVQRQIADDRKLRKELGLSTELLDGLKPVVPDPVAPPQDAANG